jgi:hypothetical protein
VLATRGLLLGALPVMAALLAACSSGPPPLVSESFSGHECAPSALGKPLTDGSFILNNTGNSLVTVTSVKLPSPHGVTMTQAWLMPQYKPPHGSLSSVGDGFPYPPTRWPTWPNRQAIPGAVIKPHQALNLFFGLTRTADRRVEAGAPVITYTAGGNTYTLQTQWAWVLLAAHSHCPR